MDKLKDTMEWIGLLTGLTIMMNIPTILIGIIVWLIASAVDGFHMFIWNYSMTSVLIILIGLALSIPLTMKWQKQIDKI